MKTILTNCTILDCTGKAPMADMTVVIEGKRIAELKPGTHLQRGSRDEVRVIDLEGGYVLPGLWDAHVHLYALTPDPNHLLCSETAIECAKTHGLKLPSLSI